MKRQKVKYKKALEKDVELIRAQMGEEEANHMHVGDGFSFVAFCENQIIGIVSSRFTDPETSFIDIIKVAELFRRQGIGRNLIDLIVAESKELGASNIRSWSSTDKLAAIEMWKKLGFKMITGESLSMKTGAYVKGYFIEKDL